MRLYDLRNTIRNTSIASRMSLCLVSKSNVSHHLPRLSGARFPVYVTQVFISKLQKIILRASSLIKQLVKTIVQRCTYDT